MRFTLPIVALLASAVMATPTANPPTVADLTALSELLAAGEPVPEGITLIDKRADSNDALKKLSKRYTICGQKHNGTCCCSICSSGRVLMCTYACGTTIGCHS
ncbi:hypothetical protein AJ80_09868 [Polytolypa hystricis UAMH7299]|uniref:Uncharacterized protein n=1 Tax=Polytolypa hystricis (strain UAMH7299) TaxID=1447883 RepID=A0A2B7WHS8_POLH7|nr:hypothetical protein AJ80_09868 [Polytolypa hystricis UAMH7299]